MAVKTLLCFAVIFVFATAEATGQDARYYASSPTVTGFWQGTLGGDTLVVFLLERDDGKIFGVGSLLQNGKRTEWPVGGNHAHSGTVVFEFIIGGQPVMRWRVFEGSLSEFRSITGFITMEGYSGTKTKIVFNKVMVK